MSPSPLDLAQQKQQAEREALGRLKAAVMARLLEMKEMQPSEAERAHEALKGQCTDKRLPGDFKKQVLDRARTFECNANMRAATRAMEEAVDFALAERLKERSARLAMGRQWFAKACSLGANDEFRKATQRLIDTAMMTGGIYKPGQATRAKPADIAPRNTRFGKA
ncbi:MAG TPA: hypothetical protein VGG27_11785 [Magnetospirillaceae bacterium]|jgi:hypothetical protein